MINARRILASALLVVAGTALMATPAHAQDGCTDGLDGVPICTAHVGPPPPPDWQRPAPLPAPGLDNAPCEACQAPAPAAPAPVYVAPAPVYQAPQPVHVAPAAPAPVYIAPKPVQQQPAAPAYVVPEVVAPAIVEAPAAPESVESVPEAAATPEPSAEPSVTATATPTSTATLAAAPIDVQEAAASVDKPIDSTPLVLIGSTIVVGVSAAGLIKFFRRGTRIS